MTSFIRKCCNFKSLRGPVNVKAAFTLCLSWLILLTTASLQGQLFDITDIHVEENVRVTYPSEAGFYYILRRGGDIHSITQAVDMALGAAGTGELTDPTSPTNAPAAFYIVQKVSSADALDEDGDGIKDNIELVFSRFLDPFEPADAGLDYDGDGESNLDEITGSPPSNPQSPVFTSLTFSTLDRFTIAASRGIPGLVAPKLPAVIFIHQGGTDRHEWDSVMQRAFLENWIVLSYDIRGHGDSSGVWNNDWYNDPNNAPMDLIAAITHLKSLSQVDTNRIGVVGSSVGGNLACVASSEYGIQTAVALSHRTSAVFNLSGQATLNFRSIFHISSTGDGGGARAGWATELYNQTTTPRRLTIAPGSAHGVSIFNDAPTVVDEILEWLNDTL